VLSPEDLGHRVVVRRIAGVRDNRPIFADALGELTELGDAHVTVQTRAGLVRVPKNEIVRAKRVPDRRRLSATEALEHTAAAGWPAPDTERLGQWLLRAAQGWTMRGNSALAAGDPGRPLAQAIDDVTAWYQARQLPPAVTVPLPLRSGLGADLTARGWEALPPVLVQTAPLAAIGTPDGEVELAAAPSAAWLAIVAGRKGGLPAAAHHILTAVPKVRFASVPAQREDRSLRGPQSQASDTANSRAPAAVARGVVTGDWLGISLVEVDPAARRRGLARRVTRALVGWAAGEGATRAYLQVEEHNTAAVELYRSLGFTTHHTYRTWIAAPRRAPSGLRRSAATTREEGA
jgi:N-acetylglutamate synthase